MYSLNTYIYIYIYMMHTYLHIYMIAYIFICVFKLFIRNIQLSKQITKL